MPCPQRRVDTITLGVEHVNVVGGDAHSDVVAWPARRSHGGGREEVAVVGDDFDGPAAAGREDGEHGAVDGQPLAGSRLAATFDPDRLRTEPHRTRGGPAALRPRRAELVRCCHVGCGLGVDDLDDVDGRVAEELGDEPVSGAVVDVGR